MSNVRNKYGKKAIGYKEIRAYKSGKRLKMKELIWAKCYDCMCGYMDGLEDCKNPSCPLYPYMPYRGK